MASLNKVFLIGNLTRDPELRYTPSGAAVADLGVAINRRYTTKDGEQREETVFVDVTVWNRQAENCCSYLRKGRSVHVEGHLRMDSWEDKNTGEKRTKIRIEGEQVQFLDSSGRRDEAGPADEAGASGPARRPGTGNGAPASRSYSTPPSTATPPKRPNPPSEPQPDDPSDEDIPF